MSEKRSRRAVHVCAVLVLAAVIGSAGAVLLGAANAEPTHDVAEASIDGTTAGGLTYGRFPIDPKDPSVPVEAFPDLVSIYGDDGVHGYVRFRDLDGPVPTSPAQALEWQRSGSQKRQVPVFASDGVTVVDHLTVG